MISRYFQKKLVWIDLESPTHEEIRQIMAEYDILPLVGQELIGPTFRPKVEVFPNFIYLVLHFPTVSKHHLQRIVEQQEVDFIVGVNFIITCRYDKVDPLHRFSKIFEVNSILNKSDMYNHGGFVFFYMIRTIYESLTRELESAEDTLRSIEEKIFQGREREMVTKISDVSRELLDVKRATAFHEEILESFDNSARKFFSEDFGYYTKSIMGEYYKVFSYIESSRESIAELRETNNSLLNTKQNEIMKIFTILAFVTFPLSLAINIVTIPSESNPLTGHPQDFWIIIAGTAISCVLMFAFFKFKRWL
ncbi:MAG: hypothetical protein EXS46_02595 [Candidatus Taylorbacteria bacterium]|nr:hypothetical protein [Candidatus Taylorbacteria bacterium]